METLRDPAFGDDGGDRAKMAGIQEIIGSLLDLMDKKLSKISQKP